MRRFLTLTAAPGGLGSLKRTFVFAIPGHQHELHDQILRVGNRNREVVLESVASLKVHGSLEFFRILKPNRAGFQIAVLGK
jgi:hypothetical protein